jgi:hypothetical protein
VPVRTWMRSRPSCPPFGRGVVRQTVSNVTLLSADFLTSGGAGVLLDSGTTFGPLRRTTPSWRIMPRTCREVGRRARVVERSRH